MKSPKLPANQYIKLHCLMQTYYSQDYNLKNNPNDTAPQF